MKNGLIDGMRLGQNSSNVALSLSVEHGNNNPGSVLRDISMFIDLSYQYDRRGPLPALRDSFPDFVWEYQELRDGSTEERRRAHEVGLIAYSDYIFNIEAESYFVLATRKRPDTPLRKSCFVGGIYPFEGGVRKRAPIQWTYSVVKEAGGKIVYWDKSRPLGLGEIPID